MGGIVMRVALAIVLLALLGVAGCSTRRPCRQGARESAVQQPVVDFPGLPSPIDFSTLQQNPQIADAASTPPPWAKVAPEQIAEAKKHGVPVAFENNLGMRFVLIPAGTFLMGSPEDEEGRYEPVEIQHEVTFAKPIYMQITEVTNDQFRNFRPKHDSGECPIYLGDDDNHLMASLDRDDQPVVEVSWETAVAFANWVSEQDAGHTYELPTDARWEQACRAGTTTRFSSGDQAEDLVRHANFSDRNDQPPRRGDPDDGYSVTAPVGSYLPNGWGLHDMHGNVWEWCADWFKKDLGAGPAADPRGPPAGSRHITRGGAFYNAPALLRCAYRAHERPGIAGAHESSGLRLVSPLPEPSK